VDEEQRSDHQPNGGMTYARAGVSISTQDDAITLFKAAVGLTHAVAEQAGAGRVLAGVGAFGAAFQPNLEGIAEPVLVSSTDGLGTKTLLHARFGSYELAGRDLVGTVINDVLCSGARPLFMLDYIGWHGLTPGQLAEIVQGVAAGCAEAGCALVGGELAEMRSIYQPGDFDLTGTGVGLADRSNLLGCERVQPGSVLLGLASSGVHANGFSLVRKALESLDEASWVKPIDTPRGMEPLWQALLAPTRCYAGPLAALRAAGCALQAAAHISGGGLQDNLPRILPEGCAARVSRSAVPSQGVFVIIQRRGQVSADEMWHVFNMGCGFVLAAAPEQSETILHTLARIDCQAFVLGEVVPADRGESRLQWAD
jgi:phosphoribosylformylglycinamidine cyclo-ligase